MPWTKEQRKAQSERMKNVRRLDPGDLKTMQAQGAIATSQMGVDAQGTQIAAENVRDGGAKVTTKGPASFRLYKRGNYGWYPVTIPANNITIVMGPEGQGNYSWECPECKGYCGEDGGPCPGLPERSYRRCPVPSCRKKIVDNPPTGDIEVSDSGAEIKDDTFARSTPEIRTETMLRTHMYYYHPTEYAALAPTQAKNPVETPIPGRMAEAANG